MGLETTVLLSGFALGLFIGIIASLINMIISSIIRWMIER